VIWWSESKLLLRACLKKEGLAFCAFIAAVGAGAVMTAMLAWQVWFLQDHQRVEEIANLAYGMLLLIAVTQISLHRLLGSKQAIELEFWKLKAKINQGDE
jgi:hypothetical protein